ncbi:hypothetical protein MHBO_000933 [Bonamia ostreae]|uniref:Uncharacterized protein n=1 Tax=Bonamia ostreae TaxID=126728 RepID=A0ABV2AHA5_9EUKA
MKKKPLTTMFKDYEDGADIAKALEFVKKKFMERAGGNASLISCHFTCATDQNGIKEAIQSVMSKTAKRRRISK